MRISDWSSDVCSSDLLTVCSRIQDGHLTELLLRPNQPAQLAEAADHKFHFVVFQMVDLPHITSPVRADAWNGSAPPSSSSSGCYRPARHRGPGCTGWPYCKASAPPPGWPPPGT